MIATALREGSHFFEWTHKRLDGEDFPTTVLLTRMEQAGVVFVQSTVRDITAQKRAEEVLRRHAVEVQREYASLQAVFDAAQSGFCWSMIACKSFASTRCSRRPLAEHRPQCSASGRESAFRCLNAALSPKGCGTGDACSTCPVRESIARALHFGEPSRGIEINYTLQVNGESRRLRVPHRRRAGKAQWRGSCAAGDY